MPLLPPDSTAEPASTSDLADTNAPHTSRRPIHTPIHAPIHTPIRPLPYEPDTGSPVTTSAQPPTFAAAPVPYAAEELAAVTYTEDGLVGAIIQDASDGSVLMFAWMNAESLVKTLETGRTWFWSRSRQEYWCKGETSGDRQYVRSVHYDCDGDALLVTVDQEGAGACHTGHRSCFYRAFGEGVASAGEPSPS